MTDTRVALGLSYDGSAYHGWQSQYNLESVQQTVEQAVAKVADHPVQIVCAGRTDTGVHALGQVVHFDTTAIRESRGWLFGINTNLPRDIRVHWVHPVANDFHARFSAIRRSYRYVIYNDQVASALLRNQTSWYCQPLDENRMTQAASYLIGEHDFSSYRAAQCQAHSPVRTIHKLTITRQDKFIFIDVTANAFLHHMIRNIAGVLTAIGAGKQEPIWAQEVLEAKNRGVGGVTALPNGLYFKEVIYPAEFNIPNGQGDFTQV